MQKLALAVGLLLSASVVEASHYMPREGDIQGNNIFNETPTGSNQEEQIELCAHHCDGDPRCLGFVFVKAGTRVPTAECWYKSTVRMLKSQSDFDQTVQGITLYYKPLSRRMCWARHFGNYKMCNVFSAGTVPSGRYDPPGTSTRTLLCPPGANEATLRHIPSGTPNTFAVYCVVRYDGPDPGGVPNCTDDFGGESRDGAIGNPVNHACLDSN